MNDSTLTFYALIASAIVIVALLIGVVYLAIAAIVGRRKESIVPEAFITTPHTVQSAQLESIHKFLRYCEFFNEQLLKIQHHPKSHLSKIEAIEKQKQFIKARNIELLSSMAVALLRSPQVQETMIEVTSRVIKVCDITIASIKESQDE